MNSCSEDGARGFRHGPPSGDSAFLASWTEYSVILACIDVDCDEGARLRTSLSRFVRWDELVGRSVQHGMLALLRRSISAYCPDLVPPEVYHKLGALQRANVERALRMTSHLLRLLEELRRVGIEALPFKGPVLAEYVYGDVGERQMADLDILVRQRDITTARELLHRGGYVTVDDGGFPTADDGPTGRRLFASEREVMLHHSSLDLLVEIHWGTGPRFGRASFSAEELLDRARPATLWGRPILTLHPEDRFLVLCTHGATHQWDRLEGVATLAALLQKESDADWDLRLKHAADRGCLYRCLVGIALVAKTSPTSLPGDLEETLSRHPRATRLALEALSQACRPPMPPSLAVGFKGLQWQSRCLDTSPERVLHLISRLVTPGRRDWEWVSLPASLHGLYYLVRPFRAAAQYLDRGR